MPCLNHYNLVNRNHKFFSKWPQQKIPHILVTLDILLFLFFWTQNFSNYQLVFHLKLNFYFFSGKNFLYLWNGHHELIKYNLRCQPFWVLLSLIYSFKRFNEFSKNLIRLFKVVGWGIRVLCLNLHFSFLFFWEFLFSFEFIMIS